MVAFLKQHGSPFDESDFAEYFARIEEPAHTTYRGYTVYKHGFSSQGPSLLQTLNILENFDLHGMGYGSADYLHTVTEAMKLSYADRDTYYADQAFVKSPAEGLLSKDYAKERAAFGKPIGSYQAIKHSLADMLGLVECGNAASLYAAWALSEEAPEAAKAAAMAKAYTSDAYVAVTQRSIQIFGAIGFTWEMKNHLYFKRARANAELFGSARAQRARVMDMVAKKAA